MKTLQIASLADDIRQLPADGAARDRRMYRLTDLHASAEAATALQAAASRAREEDGALASALLAASALWSGGLEERDLYDAEAYDRLRKAVLSDELLTRIPAWVGELREVASERPGTGACTLASAFELWLWTTNHFRSGTGSLEESASQALDELVEILCPLLAGRSLALELTGGSASGSPEKMELRSDLSHVQAARASAAVAAACAELVFGYRRHLVWDAEGCATCYAAEELDDLEALMPGIASGARVSPDIIESDGSHPAKAGPCARFEGLDAFMRLRNRLDGCLTGARFAKERAVAAIARSMTAMVRPEGEV
jgi:hypothetical protein